MSIESVSSLDLDTLYPWSSPWLRVNFVMTLDGATTDSSGISKGIASAGDSALFSHLRSGADAVLVGAGTYRAEQYKPLKRDATLCVVSRSLELDPDYVGFTQSRRRPIIVTCEAAPAERREALSRHCDVIFAGTSHVDLPDAVTQLHARGLTQVLCEGGPQLFADLLDADLVDDLCLTVVSRFSTDPSAPRLVPAGVRESDWVCEHTIHDDDSVYTRWSRSGKPVSAATSD